MLVVTRHRVPPAAAVAFRDAATAALEILSGRPGWRSGRLGRSVDDGDLWVIATEWENVGSYRRALSSYEVKAGAVAVLSTAIDEPSAFEVIAGSGVGARAADADVVGLGDAAAPVVPTDLDGPWRSANDDHDTGSAR
jgi:heme-degrading monooxygenase HmoA